MAGPDLSQGDSFNASSGKIFTDRRIWWIAIFALLGAIVYFFKDSEAFPTASLDLNIPREEIARKASDWSHKLGYDKKNTINSTTFFEDESTKTFLEFEMGTERGGELMRAEIPVWMWVSRFCKEHDPEECSVFLAPDGSFLKFKHTIPNDLSLPTLSHDEAEKLARDFTEKTAGHSLEGYKLVGDETSSQLKRKDYSFTWENRKTEYKGARERIRVEVDGNRVGEFSQPLHLPEEWLRRYEKMRSYNLQLYNIANIFWNIFVAAATITFLWAVTSHKIRWKVTMGFAGFFALIQVIESLNGFPTIVSLYEPLKGGYNAYITDQLLSRLVSLLLFFVIGVVFAGAAEVIYRISFPRRIAAENWLRPRALASLEISKGLVVGNIAPMLYLGWIISYYLLGKHIGFYTPLSLENYRAVASSFVPAFSAVSLGVFASTHEEIIYRVVALNLSQKLMGMIPGIPKNKHVIFWVCNLFQAVAWGFMHSTYPQQPCYARGLELSFSGLVFGWIFQTFGLLPCIASHYLIDCFLGAKIFLGSAQPVLSIPAALAIAPFLVLLIFALVKRSQQAKSSDATQALTALTNESVSDSLIRKTEQEVEPSRHLQYQALPPKTRKTLIAVVVLFFLCSIWAWRPVVVGRDVRLTINRAQAERLADKALKAQGVDGRQYQHATFLTGDTTGEELQYIREKTGREMVVKLANLEDFGFAWIVRYFRPLEVREYQEWLDGRGVLYAPVIVDSEDEPGAVLKEKEAIKIASDYIHKSHPEFLPIKFDGIEESRREHRSDFQIYFESPEIKIGDAPSKVHVKVTGDKVTMFKQGWHLPDTWKDEFERKKLRDEVMGVLILVYRFGLIIMLIWWTIGLLRSGAVRWRLPLILSGALLVLAVIGEFNSAIAIFYQYPTTTPVDTFITKSILESLQRLLWSTLFMIFPAALALAVFKLIAPDTSIYAYLRVGFRPADSFERLQQRQLWLDGVICGFSVVIVRWVLSMLSVELDSLVSPQVQASSLAAVAHLGNVYCPQFDIFSDCLSRSVKETFNMGILVGFYQKFAGSFKKALLLVVVMLLLQYCQDRYWQDYVVEILHSLVDWIIIYIFVAKFAKRNIYAYLMYGLAGAVFATLPTLLLHAPKVMMSEIISCVIALLLPIAWVVWLFSNKISPQDAPVSPQGGGSTST